MIEALKKHSISEFTRAEFLDFVDAICRAAAPTEEEGSEWVGHFDKLVAPHPKGADLIFWPEEGADDSPEGVVAEVERYCRANGLPCFRDSED